MPRTPTENHPMEGRRLFVTLLALSVLVASLVTPVATQGPFPSGVAGSSFAILNVRVFDGTDVHERQTVLVRDGRIQEIGDRVAVPEATPEVDGTGHTLFPGLIDAHTHTFGRDVLVAALRYDLTEDTLEKEFATLRDWGQRTRERLS